MGMGMGRGAGISQTFRFQPTNAASSTARLTAGAWLWLRPRGR